MKTINHRSISIHKFEKNTINEDAAVSSPMMAAVSDGAGGGGVYAERWSSYLLDKLPEQPINSYEEFDTWVDGIWEVYYAQCENDAKLEGGLFLDKFYDEGSFATIAAVWKVNGGYEWLTYGDSVVFFYNHTNKTLTHSFSELRDFNNPPYLVSCNNPLKEQGFSHGVYKSDDDITAFVASDALSHYVLAAYEASHVDEFADELERAMEARTKLSDFVRRIMTVYDSPSLFYPKVLRPLLNASCSRKRFRRRMKNLELSKCLLSHDDFSFAWIK